MSEATTMPLWRGADVIAALQSVLTATPSVDWMANGLSIDTRDIKSGDIFVALPGEKADGHDFVIRAFESGAAAALVRPDFASQDVPSHGVLLPVPDVLQALELLGRAARARSAAYITAITGSVGKTGVKSALAAALGKTGAVHASEKSFNNHIGVPLSLARLPQQADYAVFELGMNHAGEIAALVDMVRPHVALITTVGAAHIEHFDSEADIARAKAEIFAGLIDDGVAIIPRDNQHYPLLAEAAAGFTQIDFSLSDATAKVHAVQTHLHPTCSCVTAHIGAQEVTFKVGTAGEHHVANSLAVLAAVQQAGGDLALAALSLADNQGLSGRGMRHQLQFPDGTLTLIDESYNANPSSMRAALTTLGLTPRLGRGRRIAVLGDMAELGEAAASLHADLAETVERADIDLVVTCGPLMQHLHEHLPPGRMGPHFKTKEDVVALLARDLRTDDVVMVKGSNASGMGQVVSALLAGQDTTEKRAG